VYSTYLGGRDGDYGIAIALDSSGFAYVAGRSDLTFGDFPTTPGAYQRGNAGLRDVFVAKINPVAEPRQTVEPPPVKTQGNPPPERDTIAPVISGLKILPQTFRGGSRLSHIARRKRPPVGTTISFRLSERASVTFSFVQYANGRKKGARCVLNRRTGRHCRITLIRGTFVVSGKAGGNKLEFQGRISRRKRLAPGSYTLQLSARDAAGNVSATRQATFRLMR
jgi:hypothetical protein